MFFLQYRLRNTALENDSSLLEFKTKFKIRFDAIKILSSEARFALACISSDNADFDSMNCLKNSQLTPKREVNNKTAFFKARFGIE
jgi:hypothetical protein